MSGTAGPDSGSLEFAHARIGARWGAMPDEAQWRRIEVTRDLAPMLDLARANGLASWLPALTVDSGLHRIESTLRRQWRARAHELAAWMPADWQASIRWCAHLVDLPAVQHWARGEALPAWAADDAVLRPLLDEGAWQAADPAWRAWLEAVRGQPSRVLAAWCTAWRRLLPPGWGRDTVERTLVPLFERHAAAFAWAQGELDGWAERRLLRARLVALLRRRALQPVEAFAFLGLSALEAERLRAEIVGRAAFPHRVLH